MYELNFQLIFFNFRKIDKIWTNDAVGAVDLRGESEPDPVFVPIPPKPKSGPKSKRRNKPPSKAKPKNSRKGRMPTRASASGRTARLREVKLEAGLPDPDETKDRRSGAKRRLLSASSERSEGSKRARSETREDSEPRKTGLDAEDFPEDQEPVSDGEVGQLVVGPAQSLAELSQTGHATFQGQFEEAKFDAGHESPGQKSSQNFDEGHDQEFVAGNEPLSSIIVIVHDDRLVKEETDIGGNLFVLVTPNRLAITSMLMDKKPRESYVKLNFHSLVVWYIQYNFSL